MDATLIQKFTQERQNSEYRRAEEKISELYGLFNNRYAPSILKTLSGIELLNRMFLGRSDNDNLCYFLEHYPDSRKLLGSIGGRSSRKYPLYYSKEFLSWKDSQGHILDENAAIILGEKARNRLMEICNYVKDSLPLTSLNDYILLGEKIGEKLSIWQLKYLHFVFPEYFPTWYSSSIQRSVLELCGEKFSENQFERIGELVEIARSCELSNAIFAKVADNVLNLKEIENVDDTSVAEYVIQILNEEQHSLTYEEIRQIAVKKELGVLQTTRSVEQAVNLHKESFVKKSEKGRGLTVSLREWDMNTSTADNKKTTERRDTMQPLNQILYGPPGTGKTYNTIIRSVAIIEGIDPDELGKNESYEAIRNRFNQYKSEGRIDFITFHQSYSYEEFVEGIKPVLSSVEEQNTSLNYCLSDGIFKQICDSARTVKIENAGAQIDFSKTRVFKMSLGGKEDADISQYCLENGVIALGWGRSVDFTETKTLDDIIQKYQEETGISDWAPYAIDRFKNLLRKGDIVLVARGTTKFYAIAKVTGDYEYRNDSNVSYHHFRSVEWLYKGDDISVSKIYNKNFSQQSIYGFYYPNREGKDDYNGNLKTNIINDIVTGKIKNDDNEPYILIIDEINRGNISKIFGELITLIEDDKREVLSVTLPYSKESFTVPKNLYILGTMNTSDRSIATIDIALRRRFQFIEMMPREDLIKDVEGIDLQTIIRNMNKKISILLDRDHQIGHAYFMGISTLDKLKTVWFDKIIPLLNEYFYGDWEKLKLIIPGFIHLEEIPSSLKDSCPEEQFYTFERPNKVDFKRLLQDLVQEEI